MAESGRHSNEAARTDCIDSEHEDQGDVDAIVTCPPGVVKNHKVLYRKETTGDDEGVA
jgi:hypothetical protein